jgi:hypothetical protein
MAFIVSKVLHYSLSFYLVKSILKQIVCEMRHILNEKLLKTHNVQLLF